MTAFVLRDSTVVVNSIDLSRQVRSLDMRLSRQEVVTTVVGAPGVSRSGGVIDGTISVVFLQQFSGAPGASLYGSGLYGVGLYGGDTADSVYATLAAVFGTEFPLTVQPSPSSPVFSMSAAQFFGIYPIQGSVGEAALTAVDFVGEVSV